MFNVKNKSGSVRHSLYLSKDISKTHRGFVGDRGVPYVKIGIKSRSSQFTVTYMTSRQLFPQLLQKWMVTRK